MLVDLRVPRGFPDGYTAPDIASKSVKSSLEGSEMMYPATALFRLRTNCSRVRTVISISVSRQSGTPNSELKSTGTELII